ncbi:MAG TPA: hypothetical protein VNR89_04005 [Roseomonas sp.]|nr:hypothetical protein [Roseomonas sp.]
MHRRFRRPHDRPGVPHRGWSEVAALIVVAALALILYDALFRD